MQQPKQSSCFERAYLREKEARKHAEQLLERRARELYEAKQRIEKQLSDLQQAHDELKLAQGQLIQSEKMASIGQLSAGIAHEINNPVAFIRSNLSSLSSYIASIEKLFAAYTDLHTATDQEGTPSIQAASERIQALCKSEDYDFVIDDCKDIVSESVVGTDRVIEIVQGLRNFSRLDENEAKKTNINDGIEATLKIAHNELRYRCSVETNFGKVPEINCIAGQINQVFLNMIVNAAQALEGIEDGKLIIRTFAQDDSVVATVEDNGCGIPEANIAAIFNPFFTTKDVGSGTGLGLSISYAIVQKHGGQIDVQSLQGSGTKFTISLPIDGILVAAA